MDKGMKGQTVVTFNLCDSTRAKKISLAKLFLQQQMRPSSMLVFSAIALTQALIYTAV